MSRDPKEVIILNFAYIWRAVRQIFTEFWRNPHLNLFRVEVCFGTLSISKKKCVVMFAVFTARIAISSKNSNVKYTAENKCVLDQNTGTYCSTCYYFARLHVIRLSQPLIKLNEMIIRGSLQLSC